MKKLSYQLYSSRNFPPLDSVLERVAKAGYAQVEGYGALYAHLSDLDGLKAALDRNGLNMATAHVGLDMLRDDPKAVLNFARVLDFEAIYCPHLTEDQRPRDGAGWRAFGEQLQEIGKPFVDAGLTFGWHNHDFEFIAGSDGIIPQEAMFEGGPDLSWEMDVAWVVRAGVDPKQYMNAYGDRISALHVKDIAAEGENRDEDGWADVGHGVMDWAGLLDAARGTRARYFVMEHDNPSDDQRFATRSIATVKSF